MNSTFTLKHVKTPENCTQSITFEGRLFCASLFNEPQEKIVEKGYRQLLVWSIVRALVMVHRVTSL